MADSLKQQQNMAVPIVLASASPRRRELLAQVGIDAQVQPADIDEQVAAAENAVNYVVRLAATKAATVAADHPRSIVIGADTCIELNGEILGKPCDEKHGKEILSALSGRKHLVHTGVAVICTGSTNSEVVTTEVEFVELSSDDINNYWQTGEPIGKAGAYAIQGIGAVLVKRIAGSYSNVVGLPLSQTSAMLARCGYQVLGAHSLHA